MNFWLHWYDRYLFIGGMPAAINQYKERESLINVPEMQNLILNAYTADMAKYTSNGESTKIKNAFQSIPVQLAKENKKFQYKLIRKGATAGLFGDSIAWLIFSRVALSCERVTRGENPLIAFRDMSAFKLYLSDVGLLSAFTGIMPEDIIDCPEKILVRMEQSGLSLFMRHFVCNIKSSFTKPNFLVAFSCKIWHIRNK